VFTLRLEGRENVAVGQALERVGIRILAHLTKRSGHLRVQGVRQVDEEAGTGVEGIHEQGVARRHDVFRVMRPSLEANRHAGHDLSVPP
jgi:hypothetical protein